MKLREFTLHGATRRLRADIHCYESSTPLVFKRLAGVGFCRRAQSRLSLDPRRARSRRRPYLSRWPIGTFPHARAECGIRATSQLFQIGNI